MLRAITINKKIYSVEPIEVSVGLVVGKFKMLGKSTNATYNVFYNIVSKVHKFIFLNDEIV